MSDNYLKEYLRKEHEKAGEDSLKNEVKDSKDMNDKIGYIHEAVKRIEDYLGTNKLDKKEQKEAIKEGVDKEEKYNKIDNEEGGDK